MRLPNSFSRSTHYRDVASRGAAICNPATPRQNTPRYAPGIRVRTISTHPLMTNWTPIQISKKPMSREITSIPDLPNAFMINPEVSKQIQRIRETERKISGGATHNTHVANTVLFFMVADALMIMAIVPGPAVLGMASGMKAKLVRSPASVSIADSGRGAGNNIFDPMKISIPPPAIRRPGIDMLNTLITTSPV